MSTNLVRDLKAGFSKQTGLLPCALELYLIDDKRAGNMAQQLDDQDTVKTIETYAPTDILCVQVLVNPWRFLLVGSSGELSDDEQAVSFRHISTALLISGPGSALKIRLANKGDAAQIGVCSSTYQLDQGPWLEDAYAISSAGTLYDDGECFLGYCPAAFDTGDVLEICFAENGQSFTWKVNGALMPSVSTVFTAGVLPTICVGGSKHTRWELVC
jgi:hypothetical protein